MRTTIEIPESLLEEARRAVNARTMRETVIAGLKELIRKRRMEELAGLAGRIDLDIDLAKSRRR